MENKEQLPTDINSIPEADRELFEGEGQETQTKPDVQQDNEKETPQTPEPPKEEEKVKEPPKQFTGVPVHQANKWRKEAQELKNKKEELEKEIERLKSTPQAKSETDDFIKKWGEKYGLSEEQIAPYRELVDSAVAPFREKLSSLDKVEQKSKEEIEQQEAKKAYDDYFTEAFASLSEEIKKEHQDISEEELELTKTKLKLKIEKEGLYATPIHLIYRGYSDFRPIPKKKTIEQSGRTSGTKSIDKNNEKDLAEALARGDIDIDEVDAIMVKKGGGRFTVQS